MNCYRKLANSLFPTRFREGPGEPNSRRPESFGAKAKRDLSSLAMVGLHAYCLFPERMVLLGLKRIAVASRWVNAFASFHSGNNTRPERLLIIAALASALPTPAKLPSSCNRLR